MTSSAAAPSLICEELPAVVEPSSLKAYAAHMRLNSHLWFRGRYWVAVGADR
jgi:hypothetical protein